MTEREVGLTLTVKKAMDILDCLGAAGRSLSAAEIGRRLQVPRSTVYRLLATLSTGGYVATDPANSQKYRLGFKVVELASSLLESIELCALALPFLTELKDIAQETVHLVVMDDGEVAYVEKVDCPRAVRMYSAIGRRGHAHSTAVGKAMLAFMSSEDVDRIIAERGLPACTSRTIVSRDALLDELRRVRKRGYAMDDVENEDGIRCVGAPVFDHEGNPIAALSVSGPAFRMSLARAEELSGAVVATARSISRQLGYMG